MYVCLCHGVTDRQVRAAARAGCESMRQLGRKLGVGTQCGRCTRMARDILRECKSDSHQALATLLAQPA
ncbi:bacterioferritin-associated ferredoxin [Mangrovitalea sediminis]|uniref:bacterioferritin-associated ferredoxin n=1 Tax=Mangrovitalea sediminis TaxID=1982043 RepID=UPI000BE59E2D|nr:bacterioferritin-associated ferredoxin [Mangrovitalea sediminis]